MSNPDPAWQKLVEAARKTPPPAADEPPPPGFAARIVAMREAIAAFARTLTWRRWSVITAVVCGLALAAVFAATRCTDDARPLINPPAQSLPRAQP